MKAKVWTVAGLELGATNVGCPVLIIHALYGLKSSCSRWHNHMAATLRSTGYDSCEADPDVLDEETGEAIW